MKPQEACEFSAYAVEQCGARASWVVSVGTRRSDAQLSCCRHLSRTCEILHAAEDRQGATLTVTPVRQWQSGSMALLAEALDDAIDDFPAAAVMAATGT